MKQSVIFLLAGMVAQMAFAQTDWRGMYLGGQNGVTITLSIDHQTDIALKGEMFDGYQHFEVNALYRDSIFDGSAYDSAALTAIPLKATYQGQFITLMMVIGDFPVVMEMRHLSADEATRQRSGLDIRLVGAWTQLRMSEEVAEGFPFSIYFSPDGTFKSDRAEQPDEQAGKVKWKSLRNAVELYNPDQPDTAPYRFGYYTFMEDRMLMLDDKGHEAVFVRK